jgi:hypothetical protein
LICLSYVRRVTDQVSKAEKAFTSLAELRNLEDLKLYVDVDRRDEGLDIELILVMATSLATSPLRHCTIEFRALTQQRTSFKYIAWDGEPLTPLTADRLPKHLESVKMQFSKSSQVRELSNCHMFRLLFSVWDDAGIITFPEGVVLRE